MDFVMVFILLVVIICVLGVIYFCKLISCCLRSVRVWGIFSIIRFGVFFGLNVKFCMLVKVFSGVVSRLFLLFVFVLFSK